MSQDLSLFLAIEVCQPEVPVKLQSLLGKHLVKIHGQMKVSGHSRCQVTQGVLLLGCKGVTEGAVLKNTFFLLVELLEEHDQILLKSLKLPEM